MITGTISITDYLHAQRLHRRSIAKWSYIASVAAATCGLVALAAGSRSYGFIALCAGAGVAVGEYVSAHFFLPRRVAKLHAQQKDLAEQFTYSWDAEHISAQSRTGSARRPWANYTKVKEDDHVFLLYHSDNIFEMLPKSWFSNSSAISEFRNLALRSAEA
jgi:YcxB-like protein